MKSVQNIFFFWALSVATDLSAINIQQFSRSSSLVYEMLDDTRLENSHVFSDFDFILTLGGSYVDAPLTIKNDANSKVLDEVISDMGGVHIGFGWWLRDNLMFGAKTEYSWFKDQDGQKQPGFGDVNVNLKWRFVKGAKYAISISPMVSIPTDQGRFIPRDSNNVPYAEGETSFLSDEGFGYGALLAYERTFRYFNLISNLGYRKSDKAKYEDIDKTDVLSLGIGAYIPLRKSLGLNLEWLRQWTFPLFNDDQEPNELYFGTSFALRRNLHGFTGVGLGNLFSSDDGNDWRVSAGLKMTFAPWTRRVAPLQKTIRQEQFSENIRKRCSPQLVFGDTNVGVIRFENNRYQIDQTKKLESAVEKITSTLPLIESIVIIGHTSRSASAQYNQTLSRKRADFVKNFFTSRGIPQRLISTKAKGEMSNLKAEPLPGAEQQNRRVEFEVIYKKNLKNNCDEEA
jgi:outer membrane protein OmpA-like peptidoglycan-associated protein